MSGVFRPSASNLQAYLSRNRAKQASSERRGVLQGQNLLTMGTNSARPYRVIGTSPVRADGYDKVTGKAIHGSDVRISGAIWGSVLRSPHPHARIHTIDTSEAEISPGVAAVIPSADLPGIEAIIVEVPNTQHPFGVRGAGEVSIAPPPAAIANAIFAAAGIRLRELPMKPSRVLAALQIGARA